MANDGKQQDSEAAHSPACAAFKALVGRQPAGGGSFDRDKDKI